MAADRCGPPMPPRGPSRASTASAKARRPDLPSDGTLGCTRVRRRLAVGRGQRLAQGGPGRPGREQVAHRYHVGNVPRSLAFRRRPSWVASGVDGRIRGIDLEHGGVTQSIPVAVNPSAIVAGAGALWLASEEAGTATRIDPRTRSVLPLIMVGKGPEPDRDGERAAWVAAATTACSRASTPTGRGAVRRGEWTDGGRGRGGRGVGGRGEEGTVARVDPDGPAQGGAVRDRESPGGDCCRRRQGMGGRGCPRDVAPRRDAARPPPYAPKAGIALDPLHPLAYTTIMSAELNSLLYDGLVGYRRVPAPQGTRSSVRSRRPRAAARRLRQDVHFHAAAWALLLRRAAGSGDGLQGLDGAVPRGHSRPASGGGVAASLREHRRCSSVHAPRAPCHLSRGIEANGPARTIAIHRTRRDGDLLHKPTNQFVYVMPAGSPGRATTGRRQPARGRTEWSTGTLIGAGRSTATTSSGPARRARGPKAPPTASRSSRTRRARSNARSTPYSAAPRISRSSRTSSAPWSPNDASERSSRGAPGQVESGPAATADWIFLNTRERPFDDLRVRQAVNFAIDRAKVVELAGGPEAGEVTCQVVPSGFPGHAPYCPYTGSPAKDGRWTAPDITPGARPRGGVGPSGRARHRPGAGLPGGGRPLLREGPARARLPRHRTGAGLRQQPRGLGSRHACADRLRRVRRRLPRGVDVHPRRGSRVRPSGVYNLSRICDRKLQRLIDRASVTLPADAAAAWAAADHRVSDLAPVVPLTRRRSAVLVSKRVGNVHTQGQVFTLLDQSSRRAR